MNAADRDAAICKHADAIRALIRPDALVALLCINPDGNTFCLAPETNTDALAAILGVKIVAVDTGPEST